MKEILDRISVGPPTPILTVNPDANRALVAVAERCMARELRDRYADMKDVLKDLQRIAQGENASRKSRKAPRRVAFPNLAWAAVGLVVAAVLASTIWFGRHHHETVAPQTSKLPAGTRQMVLNITTAAGQVGVGGFADGTGGQAQFWLPNSIAADSSGNIYVADTANNTIRKVTPAGVVTTLAGLAASHGSADGAGADARFFGPFGIAVDGAGNIYVADTGNNTIRKITPGGVVSTFAGAAGQPGAADGTGASKRASATRGESPWTSKEMSSSPNLSNHAVRKGITSPGEW